MHRRRVLILFATAIGVSVSSQAHAFRDPESCHDHVEWVAKLIEKMQHLKVGDTRKNLLRAFKEEGGLSTGLQRTYVSQDCPLFQGRCEIPCDRSARPRPRWASDFGRKRR